MPDEIQETPSPPTTTPSGIGNMVGTIFGGSTLAAFIVSRIWKWWTDRSVTDSGAAVSVTANDATAQFIQRQENRISQLESRIDSLEARLEAEVRARREAQDLNNKLNLRIYQLEGFLRERSLPIPPPLP